MSNKVKDTLLRMFAWVANFVMEKDANNSKKKKKRKGDDEQQKNEKI